VLVPSSILPAKVSESALIPAWKNSAPFKNIFFEIVLIFYDYVSRVVCARSISDDAALSNKEYKS